MNHNDVQWVSQSLAGNRDSFAQIVAQYQSLICSLAYNATGDLAQSEDLAQETFVIAWKQLHQLREPAKLRSWLCSIARSVISGARRREVRDPVSGAGSLELIEGTLASGLAPSEEAVRQEEEAILWRSIAAIPETYREALILYYRDEESVARVAEKLELTEDAVKQRLTRGRKLLAGEVIAFVEGMLKRTSPGKAFTLGVIVALPAFTLSAKAAAVGATAGKGTAIAKAAAATGFAAAISGPLLGFLGGGIGVMASLKNTESTRERKFVMQMTYLTLGLVALFCLFIFALASSIPNFWKTHPLLIVAGTVGGLLAYGIALVFLVVRSDQTQRRIRLEERAKTPLGSVQVGKSSRLWAALTGASQPDLASGWEYRSRWSFFGLPLVHVRMGCRNENGKLLPARGWLAVGEIAHGGLVALGSMLAMAPVSLAGGAAIGGLAMAGGCAAGVLPVAGGMGLGVLALAGGAAIGWTVAVGGMAVSRHFALGGAAFAHDYALGGMASARHANDIVAQAAISGNPWISYLQKLPHSRIMHAGQWSVNVILPVLLVAIFASRVLVSKKRARTDAKEQL